MFWVVLLLIMAQAFFMAKGIQNVPVFLYNMYSSDHQPMDSFPVILVKTPRGYYNHKQLSAREQEMLLNSVSYYTNLKHSGDGTVQTVEKRFRPLVSQSMYAYLQQQLVNDSTTLALFPAWWGRYYKAVTGDTSTVTVVQSYVYPQAPYSKSGYDSIIFTIKPR